MAKREFSGKQGEAVAPAPPTSPTPAAPVQEERVAEPKAGDVVPGIEEIEFFDPEDPDGESAETELVVEPIPDHLELARVTPADSTPEAIARANQQAAKLAVDRMKHTPLPTLPPPVLAPPSAAVLARIKPKVYRLMNDCSFGQSKLRAGKEFTENQYPIEQLRQQGARLEEVKEEAVA